MIRKTPTRSPAHVRALRWLDEACERRPYVPALIAIGLAVIFNTIN